MGTRRIIRHDGIGSARVVRPLVLALAISLWASAAFAQPYLYIATSGPAARDGLYFVDMPPRLVTYDSATGQALNSLALTGCDGPSGVAAKPDGTLVFVSCEYFYSASTGLGSAIIAINPATKQIVDQVLFPSPAVVAIAMVPDGSRLVAVKSDRFVPVETGTVVVLDTTTRQVTGTVVLGNWPGSVVVTPDGSRAYVSRNALGGIGVVEVVDLTSLAVVASISVGEGSSGIAVSGDGSRVAVITGAPTTPKQLKIISTSTNTIEKTVDLNAVNGFGQVALNFAGTRAYISNEFDAGAVPSGTRVYDLATGQILSVWPPPLAGALALSPAGDRLYVIGNVFNPPESVVTLNAATGAVVSTGTVRGGPKYLTPAPNVTPPVDPCTYAISFGGSGLVQTAPRTSPAGTTGRVNILALPDRCAWTLQSDAPWITFELTSGTGPDPIGFTILPNTTGIARTGTITAGGQTLTVTQAGCTDPIVFFDVPTAGTSVVQPVRVGGWAINRCAPSGTGMDPWGGGNSYDYGRPRPDVAAVYGAQFNDSGFDFLQAEQGPGTKTLSVSFEDTVTGNLVTATVTVTVQPSFRPFGFIDTPAEGAVVSGAIPITGWALDDVGLQYGSLRLPVFRNALPGEPPSPNSAGRVFVGFATRVRGARPDVQAAFPGYPDNDLAGFGMMVLTNMLPNGGNGQFTFTIDASDRLGTTTLGPRTIAVNNESATQPFGTIDTPDQGATVSGTVNNFGWALTPDSDTVAGSGDILIPTNGSTSFVFIDGLPVAALSYNLCRGTVGNPVPAGVYCDDDVSNIFGNPTPQPLGTVRTSNPTRRRNLDAGRGPIGLHQIDTTALSNGLHTIAWSVTDSAGRTEGIGSRFFNVLNAGTGVVTKPAGQNASIKGTGPKPGTTVGWPEANRVSGRSGFDLRAPFEPLVATPDGTYAVSIPELGRIELRLGPVDRCDLVANGTRRELPIGSSLEPATGQFTWAPPAGYLGTYRLVFVRGKETLAVNVTVRPIADAAGKSEIRMALDTPEAGDVTQPIVVQGWALDPQAWTGSGIDAVHVWAVRRDLPGTAPRFLGAADLGVARPDVADAFGAPGFRFVVTALAPGSYDLTVYARSHRTGEWEDARTVRITAR